MDFACSKKVVVVINVHECMLVVYLVVTTTVVCCLVKKAECCTTMAPEQMAGKGSLRFFSFPCFSQPSQAIWRVCNDATVVCGQSCIVCHNFDLLILDIDGETTITGRGSSVTSRSVSIEHTIGQG